MASAFVQALRDRNPDPAGRRWLYVPYDQLTDRLGPLAAEDPEDLGIVLVENPAKGRRRPYHRQKLAWVLANGRHFALEQAARGVAVRHVVASGVTVRTTLEALARELGGLRMMEAAERELREDLAPLVEKGAIEVLPHDGWLTTAEDFEKGAGKAPPWRMDAFYRRVRQRTGLLMEDEKPLGGKYSHDAENREAWSGEPPAPKPPTFRPDAITEEVGALIEGSFAEHPGRLDLSRVAATSRDAARAWRWAREQCLPTFGPYEDAMSKASRTIFHTLLSPLLHLHRVLPHEVVEAAAALDAPIASREGFVRQVLGWREFMHHVHRRTDGFRDLPEGAPPVADRPGDGDWTDDEGASGWKPGRQPRGLDGGAAPSVLEADEPVPPAFWGRPSGLACLDEVVASVWEDGYSHHITRLMVLGNLATLLDVSPRRLTDWFWVAYVDAYDWVVEPNVLGMGTFGLGPLFTTKPYVSGAAYIDRMSDYCESCAFDPKKDCPITPLYWAFLARHEGALADNPRLRMPMASMRKRAPGKKAQDTKTFNRVREALRKGERLEP